MQGKKFLIIRAFPQGGMGALLEHVVNSLLYAELTNRIPIAFWKERARFWEDTNDKDNSPFNNAFEYYFKPLSEYSITEVIGKNYTYFPANWADSNILDDNVPPTSNAPLPCELSFPGSDADVLVGERQQQMYDLQPNIPKSSYLSTLSDEELWHAFYSKYIFLKDDLKRKIRRFYKSNLQGRRVVGVHVRKTDKRREQPMPFDSKYIKAINSFLSYSNDAKIFFGTDCQKTLEKFKNIYKDKMIYTDSLRSTDASPVHLSPGNGRVKGEQFLIDMYLLSKCNYFIGTRATNMARGVLYMLNEPSMSKKRSTLVSAGYLETLERETMVSPRKKRVRRKIIQLLKKVQGTI